MSPFPILSFVACKGDSVAEEALRVLENAAYRVSFINEGGRALPEHVAIVGWSKHQQYGLKHGFPGGHVRIPPANRVDRNNVPPPLKACKEIVYVRKPPEETRKSSEAFQSAVLNMALGLRRR